jgi:hypothetical protein
MSPKKPASLKRQGRETPKKNGGILRIGNPGNAGGGRPKDEFKARMRELASGPETEAALTRILKDSTHPHYMRALAFAAEHGYGKPTDHVELSGQGGGPLEMTVRFVGAKK